MKLAIVIERIEAWRGGAETSTLELTRLLVERGHELHLITASRSPSPPDMTIHHVGVAGVIRPLRTAAFIRRATDYLASRPFDLVHAVVPMPDADVFQPRGGLIPEVLERNVALRTTASRRILKRTLSRMNIKHNALLECERRVFRPGGPLILAVSQYVARQCERHYGASAARVRVVFNGVTVEPVDPDCRAADRRSIRAQYGLSDETVLLLFVAHNLRLKGLGTLIEALDGLQKAGRGGLHLLVVGRDNPVRFTRIVQRAGLRDVVTFTGPTQRVGAFYHAADVCVHPTYYDPCSRVVLEALSRGLPCITTGYNGAAEIMEDGREGFVLAEPDDAAGLARCLEAMTSAELRSQMSKRAVELRDRVAMVRHVAELDEVYAELVGTRSRSKTA